MEKYVVDINNFLSNLNTENHKGYYIQRLEMSKREITMLEKDLEKIKVEIGRILQTIVDNKEDLE